MPRVAGDGCGPARNRLALWGVSMSISVRGVPTSGEQRLVADADAANLEGGFFVVSIRGRTVLTLLANRVVYAEILKDGAVIKTVNGAAPRGS